MPKRLLMDQSVDSTGKRQSASEKTPSAAGPLPPHSVAPKTLLVLVLTLPVTITVLAIALDIFRVLLRLF
jgi:hypothetical protein